VSEGISKPPNRHAYSGLYVRARPGLKLRDKKVERLARKMRNHMPWLQESDFPACRAWAEMEILCEQAYAVLRAGGLLNHEGDARHIFGDYRKMRSAQATWSVQLGMTPMSRIALKANATGSALDLAKLLQSEDSPEGSESLSIDLGGMKGGESAESPSGVDCDRGMAVSVEKS
jgi:hypothetical protein